MVGLTGQDAGMSSLSRTMEGGASWTVACPTYSAVEPSGKHVAFALYCRASHLVGTRCVPQQQSSHLGVMSCFPGLSYPRQKLPAPVTHTKAYIYHQPGEGDCASGFGDSNPDAYS